MIKSAGIVIIKDNKILLVKPKNVKTENNWSIPKGIIDKHNSENIIETAIRETFEETGILIPNYKIDLSKRSIISYVDFKGLLTKVIFYFIVEISNEEYKYFKQSNSFDLNEIETLDFFSFREARKKIYWKQQSVLNFLKTDFFCLNELELLLKLGYIYKVKHPTFPIWLYNITKKCKQHRNWNYTTLSCRGLILDDSGKVIARPLKKFFEKKDIYPEILEILSNPREKFEKLDGALGITYKYKNDYYVCSKNNFNHHSGTIATDIFYNSHLHLNLYGIENYTPIFEIVSNKVSFTINYGVNDSIYPIAFIENNTFKNNFELLKLIKKNDPKGLISEGYVEFYDDGTMIKYKHQDYMKEYESFKNSKKRNYDDNYDKTSDNLINRKKILEHGYNNYLSDIAEYFNSENDFIKRLRFWI